MRINKFNQINENTHKTYYEVLGYDMSMTDYLSKVYQLWTDAEELAQISADEQDTKVLTIEQNNFLKEFLKLWDMVGEFEHTYNNEKFILKRQAKKFNI